MPCCVQSMPCLHNVHMHTCMHAVTSFVFLAGIYVATQTYFLDYTSQYIFNVLHIPHYMHLFTYVQVNGRIKVIDVSSCDVHNLMCMCAHVLYMQFNEHNCNEHACIQLHACSDRLILINYLKSLWNLYN